ncbi:hypothetical protein [Chitinophaga sp.]|uniref:hypothetical protein n=1 Tax=Chitinophaga sp. TaxID=1869181 RepID=UPI0026070E95|nr:hypothetical protein [uncultured Chitinophaga sp.]
MKSTLLLFLTIAAIAASSCKKDKRPPNLAEAFRYSETACSDPWVNDIERGNPSFARQLEKWLETKTGAEITTPFRKMYPEKTQLCYACSCTTGNVIYVWPPAGSEQKFIDLGFTRP